ncbi:MAG: TonB-dependent receptor [Pseudomonadota bacterium]
MWVQSKQNKWACLFASLLTAGVSGSSHAQDNSKDTTENALDDVLLLETIVVEGERTNRLFKDTWTSAVVVTDNELSEAPGVETLDDVLGNISNVVSQGTSSNSAPAVRGIDGTGPASGTDAFIGGTRPRLNYTIDGRTLSFNEAVFIDQSIWDAQQVEVYRGPQSTLQGRNSIAGAVAIKTNDPTFDAWEGRLRAVGGGNSFHQFAAALGGPVVDDILAVRFAGEFRGEESFINFTPYGSISDPDKSRSINLRGKVLLQPFGDSDFQSLLTFAHVDAFSPQALPVVRPFTANVPPPNLAQMPRIQTVTNEWILNNRWQVTDNIEVSLLGTAVDIDMDRFAPVGGGPAKLDSTEYTLEPRVRFGDQNDLVSGFLAAYYFNADSNESFEFIGTPTFEDETLTRAVFGEINLHPTERLNINIGARYEEEQRDRTGFVATIPLDYHDTFNAFLPRISTSYDISDDLTIGGLARRGYNPGGTSIALFPPFPVYEYDAEYVNNYEIFVRAQLFDGRLDLRANAFYNNYKDLQVPFQIAGTDAGVIENVDNATTYGLELETRLRATEKLDLQLGLGLLHTDVEDTNYGESYGVAAGTINGNQLARAPAFTLTAGFTARPFDNLSMSFNGRYSDTYYSDVFNQARGKVDPYFVADAEASYNVNDNARFFVSATNLFDTRDVTSLIFLRPNPALDAASITPPRRIMAGFEFKF